MRIEPPPSLPVQIGIMPDATAAAEPPDEPPGVRSGFHGLRVMPCSGEFVQFGMPNSGDVVSPTSTAPAARSRAASVQSRRGDVVLVEHRRVRVGPALRPARAPSRPSARPAKAPGPRRRATAASISPARAARLSRRGSRTRSARRCSASTRSSEHVEQLHRRQLAGAHPVGELPRVALPELGHSMLPRSSTPRRSSSAPRTRPRCPPASTSRSATASRSAQSPKCSVPSVRQDPDDDREVPRERHDRERLEHPRAHAVERHLRTGHVRDDEVEERLAVDDPRGQAEQRRRDVLASCRARNSAPTACSRSFRSRGLAPDRARAARPGPARRPGSVHEHRRHPVAELQPLARRHAPTPGTARAAAGRRDRRRRDSNSRRSPPATPASTTSFTVPPSARRGSPSRRRAGPARREAPAPADRHVDRRARRDRVAVDHRAHRARRARRCARTCAAACGRCGAPMRTISAGSVAALAERVDEQPARARRGLGDPRGGSRNVGSGVKSSSTVATSTPETPSTSAWCVFWMSPTLPPSSPSTNHSSHSGRVAVEQLRLDACRSASSSCSHDPGLRQRGEAHVVRDVEAVVVDPDRPALLERHRHQPLAEARDQVQPGRRRAGGPRASRNRPESSKNGAPSKIADRAHVHRGLEPLQVQERRVERAEPVVAHGCRSYRHACPHVTGGSERAPG